MPHRAIELIQSLSDKGITVHVLNMGMMDNTLTGKLARNVMLAFAEFERDMIVERTGEGKAMARQNPDFKRADRRSMAGRNQNSFSFKERKRCIPSPFYIWI